MVPQSKRPEAFNIFNMTLSGHTGDIIRSAQEQST